MSRPRILLDYRGSLLDDAGRMFGARGRDLKPGERMGRAWVIGTGEWEYPGRGTITVTTEKIDAMIAEFHRIDAEVQWNANHSAGWPGAEALDNTLGWTVEIERDGDDAWATVRWLPDGVAYIESGKAQYVSPEFDFDVRPADAPDLMVALKFYGAALTPIPFFERQPTPAVFLASRAVADRLHGAIVAPSLPRPGGVPAARGSIMTLSKEQLARLGLPEGADKAAIVARLKLAATATDAEIAVAAERKIEILDEAQVLVDAAKAPAPTPEAPAPDATPQLVEAVRKVAALEARLGRQDAEREVDTLIGAKKIPASARQAFVDLHLIDGTPSKAQFHAQVATHAPYAQFMRDIPGGGDTSTEGPRRIDARRFRLSAKRTSGTPEILELSQDVVDQVEARVKAGRIRSMAQFIRDNYDSAFPDDPQPTK